MSFGIDSTINFDVPSKNFSLDEAVASSTKFARTQAPSEIKIGATILSLFGVNSTTKWTVTSFTFMSLVEIFENLLQHSRSAANPEAWLVLSDSNFKNLFALLYLASATNPEAQLASIDPAFVEVTGLHTNDAKVLHETFVVKVTGSRVNNAKTLHETVFVEVTDSNPV